MDSKRAMCERVGDDMAEFVLNGEKRPELLECAQRFRRAPDGGLPVDPGRGRAGAVRLAPDTKAHVRRSRPARRSRVACAALGSAIFGAMSIGSLAILGPPLGYIFGAGTAALAVILPTLELRGNA